MHTASNFGCRRCAKCLKYHEAVIMLGLNVLKVTVGKLTRNFLRKSRKVISVHADYMESAGLPMS